jgi:hypothetical protein
MPHQPSDDRTLQDDRAALDADPGQGSLLSEGEGAPLAEDGATAERHAPGVLPEGFLGGAPIGLDLGGPDAAHDPLAAPGDRPIDD